ncbi:hypothetical protein ACJJIF_03180 [Microbulbifer sp. SSSA002]|uniref:hypothetical protein n=1 Tax=unclassified Microbulbifer TaxID=2619833 RepID=UPI0040398685
MKTVVKNLLVRGPLARVLSVFSVLLLISAAALAEEYIYPTPIPFTNSEREALFSAVNEAMSSEQKKQAYLAQLARLTSMEDTELKAVEELETLMQSLQESLPDDPELNAALGSTTSFKSSFYLDRLAKLSLFSRRGNRIMDRAVKQAPFNLGARLQRGINCANMPAFLKRARYAVEDLALVREQVGSQFGKEFLGFVEFYLAQAYNRNKQADKARLLWEKVAAESDTEWSVKAKQALGSI